MPKTWQLQEAKAKFSAVVEAALHEGPQFVTRHGEPAVVVLSQDEFERLKPKKSLVEFFKDSPFYGLDIDLSRDKDTTSREIEL